MATPNPLRSGSMLVFALLIGLATCVASGPQEAPLLVQFHRSGGIAGVDDALSVYSDGTASASRKSRGAASVTVAPEQMTRLRALLDDMDFSALRAEYISPRGADLFQYEVTYRGRTVRADDMSMPPELADLVGLLGEILGSS